MSKALCRLCLSEDEFNVSLFGSFCRRNNMIEKINSCLNIVIKRNDRLETICYKCAENIQNFYNFIELVKEAQISVHSSDRSDKKNRKYVPKLFDMDDTFSFQDVDDNVDKKMPSSPLFSYFSPPNAPVKKTPNNKWKMPQIRCGNLISPDVKRENCLAKSNKRKQCSRDLFDSQSQELEEETKLQDTKGKTDDKIIKKIRQTCYMNVDF